MLNGGTKYEQDPLNIVSCKVMRARQIDRQVSVLLGMLSKCPSACYAQEYGFLGCSPAIYRLKLLINLHARYGCKYIHTLWFTYEVVLKLEWNEECDCRDTSSPRILIVSCIPQISLWAAPVHPVKTLRTRQNGCHFADDIFKCIFLNENFEWRLKFHWSLFLRVQLTIF